MSSLLLGLLSLIGESAHAQKPDILILFADDQRAHVLGCSGKTYIKTPKTDKLAERDRRYCSTEIKVRFEYGI